jgi:hypothetical protein
MSNEQETGTEKPLTDAEELPVEEQSATSEQQPESQNEQESSDDDNVETQTDEIDLSDDGQTASNEPVQGEVPGAIPESGVHEFSADDIDLTEVESQLQSLVPAVLDLTEHVTRTTELNGDLRDELEQTRAYTDAAIRRYQAAAEQQKKLVTIMLGVSIAVLVICSGLIGITAVSYGKQSNNMNAMSLALSKRIGEVSSGLATFEQINSNLALMNQSIEALQLDSELMRNDYENLKAENRNLINSSLAALNEQLETQAQNISDRFAAAESQYQATNESLAQASDAIGNLGNQVVAASSKAEQLLGVQEALDALVVLEQEKYLEQMRAQLEATRAESGSEIADETDAGVVQYSRSGEYMATGESE